MQIRKKGETKNYWLRIFKFGAIHSIITGLFIGIGARISGVRGINSTEIMSKTTLYQKCVIFSFALLGTVLILWYFMKKTDKEPFINLGLHTKHRLYDAILGFVIGFVVMALAFGALFLSKQIVFIKINYNTNLHYSIWFFAVISLLEELIFRAYVLRNLIYSFNKYFALIASSFMFSIVHIINPNFNVISFLSIFFAGIMLGISYIYTKNLWFPIALHFSWNFFQTFFGFNVSGIDSYSFIQVNLPTQNILNGGSFGFEGSILSILAELSIIIAVVKCKNRELKCANHSKKLKILTICHENTDI